MDGERGRSEVPAPDDDSRRVPDLWLFSEFGTHVLPSLKRIASASASRSSSEWAWGFRSASRWARLWTMPHIEYWRAMPPPALLPISIVLLGIFDKQKVALIAFFCLFPILLNAIDGVRGIEPTLMETARSYGIPWRETVRRIVVPAAMPPDSRRHANEPARGDHHGAGGVVELDERRRHVLLISKDTLQFTTMWVMILLIGLLGYASTSCSVSSRSASSPGTGAGARPRRNRKLDARDQATRQDYGFGEKATHAIGDVSFAVADGEFVCVVGPSGAADDAAEVHRRPAAAEPGRDRPPRQDRHALRPRRWRSSSRSTAARSSR